MKLELKNIAVHYDKIEALKEISFSVAEKDFITLIGSNGAGKSTILRTISGLVASSAGEIYFDNKRIDKLSPDKILKMGIAQVPEGRKIFKELTALENLYLGAFIHKDKKQIEQDLEIMFNNFPILKKRKSQLAGTMSGGEQQMLSIARALMSRPRFLLLDEPSLGLAPVIVEDIFRILKEINQKYGVAIILVEQNAELALDISQYAYVLENGKITLQDKSKKLLNNKHIKKAYLGI